MEEKIRLKLLENLDISSKDPRLEVSYLFTEIDTDMDGYLSRSEAQILYLNNIALILKCSEVTTMVVFDLNNILFRMAESYYCM